MACDDRTDEADRTRAGQGQGRGSMEVSPVTAYGLGNPPLVFEVRRVMGSGVWHNFHWCCRGRKLFVSVQQNNNNTLHTNLNCKIEQDITYIVYNVIVLKKSMKNEKVPRKNSKKTTEINIEYSCPYITELLKNMPKMWISDKNYTSISIGELDSHILVQKYTLFFRGLILRHTFGTTRNEINTHIYC